MRYIKYALIAVFGIVLIAVALANRGMVSVQLIPSDVAGLVLFESPDRVAVVHHYFWWDRGWSFRRICLGVGARVRPSRGSCTPGTRNPQVATRGKPSERREA